jgi:tRNA-binding protein
MKVSNKKSVIRIFMHHDFAKVMMIKFNDEAVSKVKKTTDAVLLYNQQSSLIGVNLLNVPVALNGYVQPDESLEIMIKERFESLNLDIDFDSTSKFVCGRIKKMEVHPTLSNLNICIVDIGDKELSIVCSAKNAKEDMLTVVALPNAVLPDGTLISDGIVAGVKSQGMLCSLLEITGGKKPVRGLIELPKGTECGSVLDIAGLGETLC